MSFLRVSSLNAPATLPLVETQTLPNPTNPDGVDGGFMLGAPAWSHVPAQVDVAVVKCPV